MFIFAHDMTYSSYVWLCVTWIKQTKICGVVGKKSCSGCWLRPRSRSLETRLLEITLLNANEQHCSQWTASRQRSLGVQCGVEFVWRAIASMCVLLQEYTPFCALDTVLEQEDCTLGPYLSWWIVCLCLWVVYKMEWGAEIWYNWPEWGVALYASRICE